MAILRKERRTSYTVIDQEIFKDKGLSLKALGMLCRLLSLPDSWEFSVEGLAELSSDGKASVMSALNELKKAGYFQRKQIRVNNKIAGVEYIISEIKMAESQDAEKQDAENQHTGKQHTEKPAQSNTNKSNNNKSNTNNKNIYAQEFETLWKRYPRKRGKEKALAAYCKARKEGSTLEEVSNGLEAYIRYIGAKGVEEQYIKHGSTWFNQKAWEDEYEGYHKEKTEYEREGDSILDEVFGGN